MSQLTGFTQPDVAPSYFIEFLEFLDNDANIKKFRAIRDERLNLVRGAKILDVGCGIGGAMLPIADAVGPTGRVVGIDLSSAMIEAARRRAGNRPDIAFHIGDACEIPYPDGFFDGAISERLFLYLPDRLGAIHEMKRVVEPGGRVCLLDTDIDSTALYSTRPDLARKMTSLVAASIPNPSSGRELPALAKQCGLKDIRTEVFAWMTPHSFFLRAMGGTILKAADDGAVLLAEAEACLAEQAALEANGDFFQAWMMVLVSGVV
jgi:ubiquinone/menaquinone biosynthesis C-methylase UbiE